MGTGKKLSVFDETKCFKTNIWDLGFVQAFNERRHGRNSIADYCPAKMQDPYRNHCGICESGFFQTLASSSCQMQEPFRYHSVSGGAQSWNETSGHQYIPGQLLVCN